MKGMRFLQPCVCAGDMYSQSHTITAHSATSYTYSDFPVDQDPPCRADKTRALHVCVCVCMEHGNVMRSGTDTHSCDDREADGHGQVLVGQEPSSYGVRVETSSQ